MFWQVAAVAALALAIGAFAVAVGTARRLGSSDPETLSRFSRRLLFIREIPAESVAAFAKARPGRDRYAFIANPTKPGVARLREEAYRACSMRYLPEPIWLYTTPDDPGTGMAHEAVAAGADVLVAVGGDGTVRAVAAAAVESGKPLGVVPLGTGNLFARNIELPISDAPAALRGVLDGDDHPVDVGWLTLRRDSGEEDEHLFLVIAGAGIDAEMVAGADDRLKKRLGWAAYFFSALRHLRAKRIRAKVTIGDQEPVLGQLRTVLFANCGRLPGGVVLVPDARITDGMLDVAVADARAGVAGWAELFGEVVLQGTGLPSPSRSERWRAGRIDHARAVTATVELETPQRVQVDGDPLGRAVSVSARVDPGALQVRSQGEIA